MIEDGRDIGKQIAACVVVGVFVAVVLFFDVGFVKTVLSALFFIGVYYVAVLFNEELDSKSDVDDLQVKEAKASSDIQARTNAIEPEMRREAETHTVSLPVTKITSDSNSWSTYYFTYSTEDDVNAQQFGDPMEMDKPWKDKRKPKFMKKKRR